MLNIGITGEDPNLYTCKKITKICLADLYG